jgi:stage II sporulation protein M
MLSRFGGIDLKFKELFKHFPEMTHYFIAATLVFGAGFVLGWQQPEQLVQYLNSQIQGLQNMSSFLSSKENPQMWFFFFIFFNNAIKAILFVFLGLFFGIMPLTMLVVNGMILGFVLSAQASESTWLLVIKGILPHGIIEIPAILIACAYGIKLGALVTKTLLHALIPNVGKTAKAELKRVFKLIFPLAIFIVTSLLAAAIIESTITFWLMQK